MEIILVEDVSKLYIFLSSNPIVFSIIKAEEKRFNIDLERGKVIDSINMHYKGKRIGFLIGLGNKEALKFYLKDVEYIIDEIPEDISVMNYKELMKKYKLLDAKKIGVNTYLIK